MTQSRHLVASTDSRNASARVVSSQSRHWTIDREEPPMQQIADWLNVSVLPHLTDQEIGTPPVRAAWRRDGKAPQRCASAQHTGRNLARSGEHTGGGSLPHRHRDCATTKSEKLRAARGAIAGEALLGHEPGDADAALSPALEGFRPTPEFPEIEQAHRLLDAQPCRHGAQGEVR